MQKNLFGSLLLALIIFNMGYAQKMTVKDSDSNVLMEVNDEGTIGSIVLPDTNTALSSQANKLYNLNGSLIWNGDTLGVAGSAGGWTDSGDAVHTLNAADRIGIGTSDPEFKLHLEEDGGILAKGTYDSGAVLSADAAGTRLIWYPRKAAFRVGHVTGSHWNDANIGQVSVALGYNTIASAYYSTCIGYSNTASASYATAMGSFSKANHDYSTAIGYAATAGGDFALSMGANCTASGTYSVAIGNQVTADGSGALAMGYLTAAKGNSSTAMGLRTSADAYLSMAVGQFNEGGGTADSWVDTDPLFEIGHGASETETANAFTVLKNGHVGIGTASPDSLFEVNGGSIRVIGGSFIDDGTRLDVPDYVFEPEYALESIEEHAAYMWKNKHLPALGSAVELKSSGKGYNISERREQILEELEKAHIYIEQLYKRLEDQQNRIEALEARIQSMD